MGRRSSVQQMALLLGTAGVAVVALTMVRRRQTRPHAITQALTIRASKQDVFDFFRDPERAALALTAAGVRPHELGLDARDDVVTWDGGGVYVREAPGGRGTEVHLTLHSLRKYSVKEAIRRAKALLEARELPKGSYTR